MDLTRQCILKNWEKSLAYELAIFFMFGKINAMDGLRFAAKIVVITALIFIAKSVENKHNNISKLI